MAKEAELTESRAKVSEVRERREVRRGEAV
jgi:hypothetical protein